ncbi:MAG: RNA-binding protein [Planctomycetota bacterium]
MGTRIYIGNLSWDTTEDSLMAALTEGGRNVKDLHIVTDRETGRPRGFAFAEFANDADAQAAIEALDGSDLDGRTLKVNEAQERKPRPGGGGGGGGGGRRRGGGGGGGDRW